MNINNLSPEQKKLILELNKRIMNMENRLAQLQEKVARVDGPLLRRLAKDFTLISLN
jgi:uncharacterized coiled-coil protein SlyX